MPLLGGNEANFRHGVLSAALSGGGKVEQCLWGLLLPANILTGTICLLFPCIYSFSIWNFLACSGCNLLFVDLLFPSCLLSLWGSERVEYWHHWGERTGHCINKWGITTAYSVSRRKEIDANWHKYCTKTPKQSKRKQLLTFASMEENDCRFM